MLISPFLQVYKNRCVLLRNSVTLNCKTVEILEGEDEFEEGRDVIRLNETWAVHEKSSKHKGRFTFEVRGGGIKRGGEDCRLGGGVCFYITI